MENSTDDSDVTSQGRWMVQSMKIQYSGTNIQ